MLNGKDSRDSVDSIPVLSKGSTWLCGFGISLLPYCGDAMCRWVLSPLSSSTTDFNVARDCKLFDSSRWDVWSISNSG
jgi:hypothetical protein